MPHIAFPAVATDDRPQGRALVTLEGHVDQSWIDYNGHMTEWQYYKVLSDAGENFLRAAGFTEEYRLQGYSFFSVESHMRNLKECRAGTPLRVLSEMLGYDDLRLHIYQYVVDTTRDVVLATGEHMMLHVDTRLRKATPLLPAMAASLERALQRWRPDLRPRMQVLKIPAEA